MSRFLSVLMLLFLVSFSLKSQNTIPDSISNKNKRELVQVSPVTDSLLTFKDSISNIQKGDSLVKLQSISGLKSLSVLPDTLSADSIFNDTVFIRAIVTESDIYDSVLSHVKDSLYFEKPDSIYYVIHNLNNLIEDELLLLNDTTKQAISKLIDYSRNREIKSVVEYLKDKLEKQSLLTKSTDTSLQVLNDSISKAIAYLLKRIPVDSVKFSFTNLNNDSILFESAESDVDSIHLNLYDNRGEYAVLWIKKSDLNVFDVYLEDGVYLEKAKSRKLVDHKVDTDFIIPEIREVRKVDITVAIWDFEGLADIKFSQGYISPSWAEGGESSMSAISVLRYSADYSYGKKRNFDTDFEYRLGYLKAGDNEMQKNDDKFEINAKYGKQAINSWYYSGLFNFKTQFFKGKEYLNDSTINTVSNVLSPAYLVFSLGLDYKPSNKLTILFSPLTSKFTIMADTVNYDQTRFGVGQNEFIRKEIGAYIKAISKLKFRDNIELESKINFFTNYIDNPQNIDVDLEANLNVKLTDYIKMSVHAHFMYDDNVTFIDQTGRERGARSQFKELFGIGFMYSF